MARDLFDFFLGSIEILVVWCISAKEDHYNLQKIAVNFRLVSLISLVSRSGKFWQNILKLHVKNLNL